MQNLYLCFYFMIISSLNFLYQFFNFSCCGQWPQVADNSHVPPICWSSPHWPTPQWQEEETLNQVKEQQLVSQIQWNIPFVSTCWNIEHQHSELFLIPSCSPILVSQIQWNIPFVSTCWKVVEHQHSELFLIPSCAPQLV